MERLEMYLKAAGPYISTVLLSDDYGMQARLTATSTDSGISQAVHEVLRRLAGEVAELAARPIEAEKHQL